MTDNQYGRTSLLNVEVAAVAGRTCLKKTEFTAPFKVMKPFYYDQNGKEVMQLMLIAVSAGIMAGDVQEIRIKTSPGTRTEFTSQSYEKIHKMPEGNACRTTSLSIGSHSFCHYKPLPVIPFAGSAFVSATEIELEHETSVLVYREILAGGRSAAGENFAYRSFENKVVIRRQGRLCYYDNTILEPKSMDLTGYGMLEGYTHMGTMIGCNLPFLPERFEQIRAYFAAAGICGGISRMDDEIIVIRIFSMRADDIIRCFDHICQDL